MMNVMVLVPGLLVPGVNFRCLIELFHTAGAYEHSSNDRKKKANSLHMEQVQSVSFHSSCYPSLSLHSIYVFQIKTKTCSARLLYLFSSS